MNDKPISDRETLDLVSLHNEACTIEQAASLLMLARPASIEPHLYQIAEDIGRRAHGQKRAIAGILGRAGVTCRETESGRLERVARLVTDGAVGEGALPDETPQKSQRKPVTPRKKPVTSKLKAK